MASVLLAVLPLADNFAEEAPPRARAGVLAVAALVGLASSGASQHRLTPGTAPVS